MQLEKRRVRICESISPADRSVQKGKAGGAPGARAWIPLQCRVQTMVRQDTVLQLM